MSTDITAWSESPCERKASVKERVYESKQKGRTEASKSKKASEKSYYSHKRNFVAEFNRSIRSARIG